MPLTPRTLPSSPSSPKTSVFSRCFPEIHPAAHSTAAAIGKSNRGPSFRMSAGARLMVILFGGKDNPVFFTAVRTRSAASFTCAVTYPTMAKEGMPSLTSASTRTAWASTPRIVAVATSVYINTS